MHFFKKLLSRLGEDTIQAIETKEEISMEGIFARYPDSGRKSIHNLLTIAIEANNSENSLQVLQEICRREEESLNPIKSRYTDARIKIAAESKHEEVRMTAIEASKDSPRELTRILQNTSNGNLSQQEYLLEMVINSNKPNRDENLRFIVTTSQMNLEISSRAVKAMTDEEALRQTVTDLSILDFIRRFTYSFATNSTATGDGMTYDSNYPCQSLTESPILEIARDRLEALKATPIHSI